jgi:hypothetical protein
VEYYLLQQTPPLASKDSGSRCSLSLHKEGSSDPAQLYLLATAGKADHPLCGCCAMLLRFVAEAQQTLSDPGPGDALQEYLAGEDKPAHG